MILAIRTGIENKLFDDSASDQSNDELSQPEEQKILPKVADTKKRSNVVCIFEFWITVLCFQIFDQFLCKKAPDLELYLSNNEFRLFLR